MPSMRRSIAASLLLGSAASLPAVPNTPVSVQVRVHDPAGLPVEGATIILGLPRYGQPKDEESRALTDKAGVAMHLFRGFIAAPLLLVGTTVARAQLHHISIQVRVHDPDNQPVAGVTVTLDLPMYARGPDGIISSQTDKEGVARLAGDALFDYSVGAQKSGYYTTMSPMRIIATEEGLRQYASSMQLLDLELKPIRNPIPMLLGGTGRNSAVIPSQVPPAGYDLVKGDWVAPWGSGTVADMAFDVAGSYRARNDYDKTLTLRFLNPADGLVECDYPPHDGSDFKFPYSAPASGYANRRSWHRQLGPHLINVDRNEAAHYVFRIRTELNPDGTVKHALYGFFWKDIEFFPGADKTGVYFNYALNPTGAPNLEIDLKQSTVLKPQ